MKAQESKDSRAHFVVVHPLYDLPEQKRDTANLGPMAMTRAVRISLLTLRLYLILITALLVYHLVAQH